jgi:hypothetical protein
MRPRIKAFLLSALVFPGLGQLYNQDRKKGIFLVLGANLLLGMLLLMGVILLSQEYMAVFYPRPLTRAMVGVLLADMLVNPLFLVFFGLLVALWGFAMVDAARGAAIPRPPANPPPAGPEP